MIDTELLDLINSGHAWVFIGSGVSVAAGLPSWATLVGQTLNRLPPDDQEIVKGDIRFQNGREVKDFAKCFQRIQDLAGQAVLVDIVRQTILEGTEGPGDLTKLLVDWPAVGYVTTNYDDLIESALTLNNSAGWIPVGNQPTEVKKVSGDVKNIVWHIHGSIHLPDDLSKLVVGSDDYDNLYSDISELRQQFQSFLTQRRLVFVGFGLRDPEIMRLLKMAGRYTTPEKPVYAFLGSRDFEKDEAEFQDLRDGYNIEVLKYRINDDGHRNLRELLEVYSSMIVRRSVTYGQTPKSPPSYDPDATGLLIYNTLILRDHNLFNGETLKSLLTARILSVAEHQQAVTLDYLHRDVGRLAMQTSGEARTSEEIESVVAELETQNLISIDTEGLERVIRLTDGGRSFVTERSGIAHRIRDQFRASLNSRANGELKTSASAAERVALAASSFFEDCIEKRSLGVAMAFGAPAPRAQEFQVVALLQALPQFFNLLPDSDSARALVKVVQGVLSEPSEAEAKHCGLLLQARLGVHLLGVDQNALRARLQALREMAFMLDSTSLIPLLAVSGTGHRAAVDLVNRIEQIGAKAMTTRNLLEEVREHAAYATRAVKESGGTVGPAMLSNLMGKEGQRTNVFLSGFAEECAEGSIASNSFALYMRQICGFSRNPITADDCCRLVGIYGVAETYLSDVTGFVQNDHAEMEELKSRIGERRRQSNSFRHDRQVLAEAEVVVLVQKLREQVYSIDGEFVEGAFFVSNSRFIDQLSPGGLPITMRQNVLLQWLGTVAPFEESELSVLMDQLLWELSEGGIDFVSRKKLNAAFASTISAAKEEYPRIVEEHKILMATDWGVSPEDAFREPIDDLNVATVVLRHLRQTSDRLQRELERAKESNAKGQDRQELSAMERMQLDRLKSEKAMRSQKNRRKARGRASKVKRKR